MSPSAHSARGAAAGAPIGTPHLLSRRLLALLLLGVLGGSALAEEVAENPPSPDDLAIYHLCDGTKLIGIYDQTSHLFTSYNPDTMEKTGVRGVEPAEIGSHRLLTPGAVATHASAGAASASAASSSSPDRSTAAPPSSSSSNSAASSSLPGTQGDWLDDYPTAVASATATGRPIVLDFTGSDWCHWCMLLHDEILTSEEFTSWARQHAVLMVADFPRETPQIDSVRTQNRDLATKYQVEGYPTVLLVDAAGKVIGRNGYRKMEPKDWLALLTGGGRPASPSAAAPSPAPAPAPAAAP